MQRLFLVVALLAATLSGQPTVSNFRTTQTFGSMSIGRDSLGRTYFVEDDRVVRYPPSLATKETLFFLPVPLLAQSILVVGDGLVYLSGQTFQPGPSRCDALPNPTVLGPLPTGNVVTSWLQVRNFSSNPAAPQGSVCMHLPANSSPAISLAADETGQNIYWAGSGAPSFTFDRQFGSVVPGGQPGWIVRLTSALVPQDLVGYGPVRFIFSVAVRGNNVAIGGNTETPGLPQTGAFPVPGDPGPFNGDGFIAVFNKGLTTMRMSTRLGGAGHDAVTSVGLDERGGVLLGGSTRSATLPVKKAAQPTFGGGADLFYGRISSVLTSFDRLSYLGAAGDEAGGFAFDGQGGTRVVFRSQILSSDTLFQVNPLPGAPQRPTGIAHIVDTGAVSYLTRLRATDPLNFGLAQALSPAGVLVAGYPEYVPGGDDRDVMMQAQDPAVDLRLRSLGSTGNIFTGFTTEVRLENLSTAHAVGAVVQGTAGLMNSYLEVKGPGECTVSATSFTCKVNSVAPLGHPNGEVPIRIKTTANAPGSLQVTAVTPDPVAANNTLP